MHLLGSVDWCIDHISVDCRSTYRSPCQSRAGQVSSNTSAALSHYSLSVDSQAIVGQYFASGSLIDHRHITNSRDLTKLRQRQQHQKAIGLVSKTTTLHVHHTLWYISLPFLHDQILSFSEDENCKAINSTISFLNWVPAPKKVMSDSLGLVDFTSGLVNSVLNLPCNFLRNSNHKRSVINLAHHRAS